MKRNSIDTKMNKASKVTLLLSVSLLSAAALVFADEHPVPSINADTALVKLKEGNARFSANKFSEGKPIAAKREETAQAQHPFAIVVACADSRTAPEIVFDANIGDLFVIRTAGNLVDEHALGSVEYAVGHLGTRLIVVLGHQRCGAVTAALAGDTAPGHVESLVRDIQPAVKVAKGKPGDALANTVAENAREVATRIRREAALGDAAREVHIISAVYSLDTGKIEWSEE
ncbi:MAG TPA: carbonic anhydrase [Chthoniobacterales bacterium]|jgi:carbonic anhydrase